jgi:hypothetical protein
VRVPIPVVILLVLTVVGGLWWKYTRNLDFMTPPSEQRLGEIRQKIESSFPQAEMGDVISVPDPEEPPPPPPPPPVDLGDLSVPPELASYVSRATEGPAALIELARALEDKGEFQRALLAWERVVDLTKSDDAQYATTLAAIRRLRPTLPDWNLKPEAALAIELHAGTGKQLAKTLAPVLESVARDLVRASSGVLTLKPVVTAGKTNSAKGAVPVALWLSGSGKDAISTDVLSFTVASPDALRDEVTSTVFQLVRSYLAKSTTFTPPVPPVVGETMMEAMENRVTRLGWSTFGTWLNTPPPKKED